MDFNLTEDRQILSDTVRRYLADQYGFEFRNSVIEKAPYHAPEKWAELAELGLVGAFVPEDRGGFGGSAFDITTVFEEIGRGLCPEPLLGALMAVRAAAACGADALVEAQIAGTKRLTFAVSETEAGETLDLLRTVAGKSGDGWVLNGRKTVVYGLPGATGALVAARTEAGIGLFLVEDPVTIDYAVIDGGGAGELILENTPATCLKENAAGIIEAALNAGRLALCSEAVGVMETLVAMTVDYLKTRRQFGRPIATFQALQHRAVDMAIEIEQCRSITILAASKLDGHEAGRFVSMAKNLIGRTCTLVSEESIQMHGGIGMTWEYPGSHYAKRLTMIDHQLGDRYAHLNRVMAA
ncbi:acyl-CoA dehydrogenase family protein [Roseibium sp. RKSG952]|uniref:acyl-CoA dehydrogenase family protein n=1 Tax=Roseibium sp. RKSG952 TaxID=2529384 RepID=UPI0012BC2669|nr:acyl-CoA dehydrogenase [Roseibium sp. RKSG952]MTI00424.1 acyl-CoA dehydrogenase [Roseibium sp. RKSG952]